MRNFGKTIKIFLIDGEPNGRMSCELSNWTGKAFKIPRKKIKDSNDRPELDSTGVYILFGGSNKSENRDIAYIGEAEGIYKRLIQHLSAKDFWNEAIVFVSKDENLNKAHIKYLESRLYEIAMQVNRYDLDNGNIPPKPNISESDQAEMEEFIENIKLLVNTLGFKIFEELRNTNQSLDEQLNSIFYIKATRGANAMGQLTNEGFVVLKESEVANSITNSFPKNLINLRESLISDGIIKKENNKLAFTKDHLFTSPSSAAAIVMGRSANGLTEWKLSDGRILKAVESN
ncbi:GIY-YIG nuclease family protein [Flavobacteriaceae bacterium XHP0103]|uniref:GIY-YIG nuclease family protein n=1 Tax=Marixanthotalea marina TaxID=2844359 RepID=UPI002989F7D1|nr:GIY-YIG nuclease family protein [Marixanthotalea marina]MBU3821615.1 GIY-YIG nuclease family protein [Marixanthotalea marina]